MVESGNCSAGEFTGPGPMSPNEIVWLTPPMTTVKSLLRSTRDVKTGKSMGSACPPAAGSPVKFRILKEFTPPEKKSNDTIPTLMRDALEGTEPSSSSDSVASNRMRFLRKQLAAADDRRPYYLTTLTIT